MTFLSLTGLFAAGFGSAGLYLGSPRQRWLASPPPTRPMRALGGSLLLVAWPIWVRELGVLTGTYVLFTLVMTCCVVLPYLGAWVAMRRER